MPFNDPK
jgi:5'-3' exonuclease